MVWEDDQDGCGRDDAAANLRSLRPLKRKKAGTMRFKWQVRQDARAVTRLKLTNDELEVEAPSRAGEGTRILDAK